MIFDPTALYLIGESFVLYPRSVCSLVDREVRLFQAVSACGVECRTLQSGQPGTRNLVVRQFEKLQRLYSPRSEEERVRRKAATKARSRLADREKQD